MKRTYFKRESAKPQRKAVPSGEVPRATVLAYIQEKGSVTTNDIRDHFNITKTPAYYHLTNLVKDGKITAVKDTTRPGNPVTYVARPGKVEAPKKRRTYRDNGNLSERILQYVSDHINEYYTQTTMAHDLDCDVTQLNRIVKDFIRRGIVVKDFNKGSNKSTAKSMPTDAEPASPKSANESLYLVATETLIWEFVKETRSTDLFGFLTWLENKSK